MLNEFDHLPGMGPQVKKMSQRVYKMGKAYANYRRSIMHQLALARHLKVAFFEWRGILQLKAMRAGLDDVAKNAIDYEHLDFENRVWNDEDMRHFLSTKGSFAEHARLHSEEAVARRDPQHKHHGVPMPLTIPASLIRLWQICLLHSHSEFYWRHFGEMRANRLLHTPLEVRADESNLEMPEVLSQERVAPEVLSKERVAGFEKD